MKTEAARPAPRGENQLFAGLREVYNPSHGIHRYELKSGEAVTGVSARSWSEFTDYLSRIGDEDRLVVSPELITVAGMPFPEVESARELVEDRMGGVRDLSKDHPETTFLLGTPTFSDEGKPRNSVVFIKNGEIIGATHKRAGATPEEREYFDLPVEEPPALIPGTSIGVLICSDLATALMYLGSRTPPKRELELLGRSDLVGKSPTFFHPEARSLVLPSCWGVGGQKELMKEGEADEYYRLNLRAISARVLRGSALGEIVVVDRVPDVSEDPVPYTPTHPFNTFFSTS